MADRDDLGADFRRLWQACAASSLGTRLALDAIPLIAIMVLDVGAAQLSWISATGGAIGALLAVPLGPWIEFRPKRSLLIRADLLRFLALATVPIAYGTGLLTYVHLMVVAVVVAVADIAFIGARGSYLKTLVPAHRLTEANSRFELLTWISTAVGPPAGGAMIGFFGPVATIVADAIGYALSALRIRAISAPEPAPPARTPGTTRWGEVAEGWRTVSADRVLRLLFAHTTLVNALILASAPPLTHLMLHDLGFTPLEYGLGFGIPCLGGLLGARLSPSLVRRFGERGILLGFGVARVLWLIGLTFVGPGPAGLLVVMAVESAMIFCMGVFTPVFAAYRLRNTPDHTTTRVLTAWTVTGRLTVAGVTALWGLLTVLTDARTAIATAGVLLIATAALLPWHRYPHQGSGAAR
ncbi:MFS transporter [Rhizohabitans arisaemae]|uniref:MFS transporter n=1 Tax=Rhizohabitans arisaemae TaxID=2720610 RepID=UPI0024B19706|nr:MFS transporter [Rhizohabitans arisaemae]